jgi:hypothetical protein
MHASCRHHGTVALWRPVPSIGSGAYPPAGEGCPCGARRADARSVCCLRWMHVSTAHQPPGRSGYRANAVRPPLPGGGPASTPSTSTHAWASFDLGSAPRPMTRSASSPCSRSNRYRTSAENRHRGRQGPTRRTRPTIRPNRRGSTRVRARPALASRRAASGSGRRRSVRRVRTNAIQILVASPAFVHIGRRNASLRGPTRLRSASHLARITAPSAGTTLHATHTSRQL